MLYRKSFEAQKCQLEVEIIFSTGNQPIIFSLFKGKVQKHQAFEAEVAANEDRIAGTVTVGRGKLNYLQRDIRNNWYIKKHVVNAYSYYKEFVLF